MRAAHRPDVYAAKDKILELASRPEGLSSADLPQFSSSYLTAKCAGMVNHGHLHRAKLEGNKVRFFTDKTRAEQVQAEHQRERVKAKALPTTDNASKGVSFRPNAEVVFTDKTKFTRCPGFQARFEAVTPSFVHTALQSGRVTG